MARRKPVLPKLEPDLLRAIEAAAEKAAKRATTRAVRQVLFELGIRVDTPEAVEEQRADAAFTRELRQMSKSARAKVGLGFIGMFFSVVGGVAVVIIKYLIEHSFLVFPGK